MFGRKDSVRREVQIAYAGNFDNPPYELHQVSPNKGFPAGKTNLRDSHGSHDGYETLHFLKGENFLLGHPLHLFMRHAVEASEVTSVGDSQPKVVEWAIMVIVENQSGYLAVSN